MYKATRNSRQATPAPKATADWASRLAGAGPPMQACGRRSAQRMAAACSALPHNTFLLASRPPPAARPPYNVHTPQQAEEPRGSSKEGILQITTTTLPIKTGTAMPCRAFRRRCGKLGQPQSLLQLKMPLLPSLCERSDVYLLSSTRARYSRAKYSRARYSAGHASSTRRASRRRRCPTALRSLSGR